MQDGRWEQPMPIVNIATSASIATIPMDSGSGARMTGLRGCYDEVNFRANYSINLFSHSQQTSLPYSVPGSTAPGSVQDIPDHRRC